MPFEILADPEFFFMSEGHNHAYSQLAHAVEETKEFLALTGENGSGKTTLINHYLNNLQLDIKVGFIDHIHAPVDQLIRLICQEFDLNVENKSSVGMLDFFHGFLLKQYEIEQRVILIIDEAQYLSPNAMEEIRVISDLEDEELHLIQVILVGQPELKYMLRRKDIEDFADRIAVHCNLDSLSMSDTEQYIRHRLNVAGAEDRDIFDEESIRAVYEHSNGIPRLINVICDTALIDGFANSEELINRAVIEYVTNGNNAHGRLSETEQDESAAPAYQPEGTSISDQGEDAAQPAHPEETAVSEQDEDAAPESQPEETIFSEQTESMPGGMVEKISNLEGLTKKIDNKLDMLIRNKDGRDRMVVELNKMLMDSLKRHGNTLKQFRDFKEKVNQEKKLQTQKDKTARSGGAPKKRKTSPSAKNHTTESHQLSS